MHAADARPTEGPHAHEHSSPRDRHVWVRRARAQCAHSRSGLGPPGRCVVTLRVGVAGAGEVVSAGLKSCLTRHGVIEFVDGDPMSAEVDVVLYDVIGMCADGGHELWDIIASGIPVIALG